MATNHTPAEWTVLLNAPLTVTKKLHRFLDLNPNQDRSICETLHICRAGTFGAISKAEQWAKDNGFSIGSMCRDEPIAMARGKVRISKWHNIDREDYDRVDGLILAEDFREGDVWIITFE